MPKVVLIIQARMGSSRLPGKSMMDLAGAPLVGRIIERVKRCQSLDHIILALPINSENDVLESLAHRYNIQVFRGSENNVLSRYYEAALKYRADIVCRLPADNATPEPSEIDNIIKFHISLKKSGFTSNLAEIYNSGYPDGIGCEVFNFNLLSEAINKNPTSKQKEHVHLNFFNYETGIAVNKNWCPINTLICPEDFRRPDLVLDINTESQYIFIRELYEYLYPKKNDFSIKDIIWWYDNIYKKSK